MNALSTPKKTQGIPRSQPLDDGQPGIPGEISTIEGIPLELADGSPGIPAVEERIDSRGPLLLQDPPLNDGIPENSVSPEQNEVPRDETTGDTIVVGGERNPSKGKASMIMNHPPKM